MPIGNTVKYPTEKTKGLLYTLDSGNIYLDTTVRLAIKGKWKEYAPHVPEIRRYDSKSQEICRQLGSVNVKRTLLPTGFRNDIDALQLCGIEPRDYQIEALAEALANNIILILPTGKTMVASMLIQQMQSVNRLDPEDKLHNKRMALFVVNTLPLVSQQAMAIRRQNSSLLVKMASSDYKMDFDAFGDPEKRPDIIVATCDIVLFQIRLDVLKLADFYLVIMDEAHNATGDHGYTQLLSFYASTEHSLRPRILGLSASPANGSDAQKFRNNIQKVEEVLHARVYRPSSLEAYIPIKARTSIYHMSWEESNATTAIIAMINRLVEHSKQQLSYYRPSLILSPNNPVAFITEIKRFDQFVKDGTVVPQIPVGTLISLFELLSVVCVSGLAPIHKRLQSDLELDTTPECYRSEIVKILKNPMFSKILGQSAKFIKMVSELEMAYGKFKDTLRGILFVNRRSTARGLQKQLKKHPLNEHINAKMFVGHSGNDGMTSEDQQYAMEEFRSGDVKLLIATSVLEEGLDVPQCNFVMCFESDLNVRSMIQRRGRARDLSGEFVYLRTPEENDNVTKMLEAEELLNKVVTERMRMDSLSNSWSRGTAALERWRERPEFQMIGEKLEAVIYFYHTADNPEFSQEVSRILGKSLIHQSPRSHTTSAHSYLSKYTLVGASYEENDGIHSILKKLSSLCWWARVDKQPVLEETLFGGFYEECLVTCGNMINPTTYKQSHSFAVCSSYYEQDQHRLTIKCGGASLYFNNESLENIILYDLERQCLYIVVKRTPQIVQEDEREFVEVRYTENHNPDIGNKFVYCLNVDHLAFELFSRALGLPFFYASIDHQGDLMDPIIWDDHYDPEYDPESYQLEPSIDTETVFDLESIGNENIRYLLTVLQSLEKMAEIDIKDLPDVRCSRDPPTNYVNVRRVFVTPFRKIYQRPMTMLSNRCLRLFGVDKFLQVILTEEDLSLDIQVQDMLGSYHLKILTEGIDIPAIGQFYYLGNSNSQARSNASWFYRINKDQDKEEELAKVRESLVGPDSNFKDQPPRKHLRALALVFPSTTPTIKIPEHLFHENIPDIERNGHIFSEGIGYIGKKTAREASIAGGYPEDTSSFQIRVGGNKGVITVHPTIEEGLYLRKSMHKFNTPLPPRPHDRVLEVISIASRKTCHLNRQIINLLTGLGVPDAYFMRLQATALMNLATMFKDKQALQHIIKEMHIFGDKNINNDADISIEDPLIAGSMQLAYQKKLNQIKDRAFIPLEKARVLLGVLDETSSLQQDQVFVRISNEDGTITTITGPVIVCKNPCLHPGDVRVLQAVDIPSLHHLIDIVAFASKGFVPNFKQCSGSDLDGDRYFVGFDQDMIKFITVHEPYLGEDVVAKDIPAMDHKSYQYVLSTQYLRNIEKGCLGKIALAHLAICDKLGTDHDFAIELSIQHFIEVDVIKTGVHGVILKEIAQELDNFASFPSFMERQMPNRKRYWESQKCLGKLYQHCSILNSVPTHLPAVRPDPARLVDGYKDYIYQASSTYIQYKSVINGLLQRYDIDREEDIIVEFIEQTLSSLHYSRPIVLELHEAYFKVHQDYLDVFISEFPGSNVQEALRLNSQEVEKLASAWYFVAYSDPSLDRVLSFGWIPKKYSVTRLQRLTDQSTLGDSLIKYVSDQSMTLMSAYAHRIQVVTSIQSIIRRYSPTMNTANLMVYGSSSVMLFDTNQSDIDVYISGVESLDMAKLALLDDDNVESVKSVNGITPILRFRHSNIDCDLSTCSNGSLKTAMLTEAIDKSSILLPILIVIIRWGREAIPVPNYAHQPDNTNKDSTWWSTQFTKSIGTDPSQLSKLVIGFFRYYSEQLGSHLWSEKDYKLVCPLDDPVNPSLNLQLPGHRLNYNFLLEMFTMAHHMISTTSGGIDTFFNRCLNNKEKVINLDRALSKSLDGNEEYFLSIVALSTKSTIVLQKGKRGTLQAKISGDPFAIQAAIKELQQTSADINLLPFNNKKNHIAGGGTTLIFQGCESTGDTIHIFASKKSFSNIQHHIKAKFIPRVKHTYGRPESLLQAEMEFNRVIWAQLKKCYTYQNIEDYGQQRLFVRFGSIYLINVSHDGLELSISELQSGIEKNSRRTVPLTTSQEKEQKEMVEMMKDLLGVQEKKPIMNTSPSNKISDRALVDKPDKQKIPKSSFFTHLAGKDIEYAKNVMDMLGWTLVDNSDRNQYYSLCVNMQAGRRVPEFKVEVKSDLSPPNKVIKIEEKEKQILNYRSVNNLMPFNFMKSHIAGGGTTLIFQI
eukprot:gene8058-9468_t